MTIIASTNGNINLIIIVIDKNKDQGEININIDEILNELKNDILKVYKSASDSSHADFHTKQTIDMLCVIIFIRHRFIGNRS